MTGSESEEDAAIRTGISRLDTHSGVLHRGCVTLLAGASGMGKSTMAINMALNARQPEGAAAAYFTSFYENGDLLLRLFAAVTGVEPSRSSLRGHGSSAFTELVRRWDIHLFPVGGLVLQHEAVDKGVNAALSHSPGLSLVVVDPVHTNSASAQYGKEDRRRTLLGFQQLAREHNVAVLLVTALSRTSHDTEATRPGLDHLRRRGLDLDLFDTVMLLHRPSLYTTRAPPELAEVSVHCTATGEHRLVSLRVQRDGSKFEG